MLLNIPKILSPELVKALCEMGHGDKILLADANFPGKSAAERCHATFLRADGIGVPALLEAILTLMPLDAYTDEPAMVAARWKPPRGCIRMSSCSTSACR